MTMPDDAQDLESAPGSTSVLTSEGWETADYIAPGDDWQIQEDGSFLAPDGHTRTFLLISPEPE